MVAQKRLSKSCARKRLYGFIQQPIKRGDKVTVWYPSANRDEDVFEDPYTFTIFRQKNPHLAFGHGIHHCLGAALARMELRVLFLALIERMRGKTVEPVGEIRLVCFQASRNWWSSTAV